MSSDKMHPTGSSNETKNEPVAGDSSGGVPELQRMVAMQRRLVQRKATREAGGQAKIPEGGGAALSEDVRGRMEQNLGADLSSVKVHTGNESATAARDLGARAFTVGSDVHFNQGEFRPGSQDGDRLIAHELAHVVQGQKSGPVARKSSPGEEERGQEVSHPDEPAELEADSAAEQVTSRLHSGSKGGKPIPLSAQPATIGRKIFRTEGGEAKSEAKEGAVEEKKEGEAAPGAESPEFLKLAQSFEVNLGVKAMSDDRASGVVGEMCARIFKMVKKVAEKKWKATETMEKAKGEFGTVLGEFTGNDPLTQGGVAGGVGKEQGDLEAVFAGGNLREQMTIVMNFSGPMSEFLTKEEGEADEFLAGLDMNTALIRSRMEEIKKSGAPKPGARAPSLIDTKDRKKLLDEQKGARDAASVDEKGKEQSPDSKRKADDKNIGAELSPREIAFQGLETTGGEDKKEGDDESKGEEQVELVKGQTLKWQEGCDKWKQSSGPSPFNDTINQLKLPFGAGPSGTTDNLMSVSELLNFQDRKYDVRLACIGYLLPIRAHSLVEILYAAQNHGCEFTPGQQMYANIQPYKPEELKGCGGGKFPHEAAGDAGATVADSDNALMKPAGAGGGEEKKEAK